MAKIATGSREEALDIVQDAMLDLVRKYGNRGRDEWKPLFYRILQNRIRDWFRRGSLRRRFQGWLFGGRSDKKENEDPFQKVEDRQAKTPAELLQLTDSMSRLKSALGELPLKQQQVFLLRAWEEFSTRETAAAMGCSEGTVKTHYSRATKALRKKLKDHWP